MINYYWTESKGKMYLCHICGSTFPQIIAQQIDGVEVQFCDECWKPEYVTISQNKNVNENETLPISEKILKD